MAIPPETMKHGTAPYLQNPDVTKPHYRGGCTAYRKGVLTHRPLSRLRGLWHAPDRNLSLREIFPEVPGAAQRVVAPREGPHALISTDVHARAAQLGAVHAAPLHCGGGVDQPSRRAQRALFEELGRGSMGMNV